MTLIIFIFCKDHRAQGGKWIGGDREDHVAAPGGSLQIGSGERKWVTVEVGGWLGIWEIKTHNTW